MRGKCKFPLFFLKQNHPKADSFRVVDNPFIFKISIQNSIPKPGCVVVIEVTVKRIKGKGNDLCSNR
ncbi:hypothetical protein Runsl_0368 [Runella slithyformis DSM 19594]|uniref:Uncharacterized protein n=1 Tax=Runella slithyformis (strain ATCC 29530 / DSM 19594 / LMG 11500 / NCIMB 11436 / LSU 4) TaxID=761193 RepID=A0A7U3ZGM1_RUNSL|nr:hypothetical protein Runsl_0368 [Runella slithyformis DSM 19594]